MSSRLEPGGIRSISFSLTGNSSLSATVVFSHTLKLEPAIGLARITPGIGGAGPGAAFLRSPTLRSILLSPVQASLFREPGTRGLELPRRR